MTTATAGQPELWSEKWQAIGQGPNACLYTPQEPRTDHERLQRFYFLDLFELALRLPATARYVEFGAGRGTTAMYLASRGCEVEMVDLSLDGFELCDRNCERFRLPPITKCLADVRQTGYASESFDCVYSIGLLEHFDDAECLAVLHEMRRVLKPNGLLFATACHAHGGQREDAAEFARTPRRYQELLCEAKFPWPSCRPYRQLSGVYRIVSFL
jgi:cyclopropane fatty-acyl-phospholipid synthase-like methyltransferase